MTNFLKKAGAAFWIDAVSAVMALVMAIVFIVISATPSYGLSGEGMCVALSIITFILISASAYLSVKAGSQHCLTAIVRVVALVLLCVLLYTLVAGRVDLISALFSWDSYNEIGWKTFYISVVCLAFLLLSLVTLIVSAFVRSEKDHPSK